MAVAIQSVQTIVPATNTIPSLKLHHTKDDFPPKHSSKVHRERPCDACRKSKSKCVIKENSIVCIFCQFHKQICTFIHDTQPRKRKERSDSNSSHKHIQPRPRPLAPKKSAAEGPEAKILGETLNETLCLQRHRHARYLGLTAAFDSQLIHLLQFDHRNESSLSLGTLRRVTDDETFIMQQDSAVHDYTYADDADALEAINVTIGPHGPALLNIYFQVVHPNFPIIQKHVFYEKLRAGDDQFSPALLASMYLLALTWWNQDENLAKLPPPNVDELDSIAQTSLMSSMDRPKLSTVQAGLLLSQRPGKESWTLTTQLVAVGQEIGLHLDCASWSIPNWEKALRKRVAWALYMQDKWSSLIHGRPSHIFSPNWGVSHLTVEDCTIDSQFQSIPHVESDSDAEKLATGRTVFLKMIELTGIMSEVLDSFFTQTALAHLKNSKGKATQVLLDKAKPIQIKLKEWHSNLPSAARMDQVSSGSVAPAGFLHLAYYATEISLHRSIIQSLPNGQTPLFSQNTSYPSHQQQPPVAKDYDPYLLYICRSAAKSRLISALDFANRLRPEHLQAFWYFASATAFALIGTFGALLCASAPAQEESRFYASRLQEYRWTLSVSANRVPFLQRSVEILDANRGMLKGLPPKPLSSEIQTMGRTRKSRDVDMRDIGEERIAEEEINNSSASLTRTTSLSLEGYGGYQQGITGRGQAPTPPSSTGGA